MLSQTVERNQWDNPAKPRHPLLLRQQRGPPRAFKRRRLPISVRPSGIAAEPKTTIITKAGTKQAKVVTMLHQPKGATLAAMAKATDWQPHSVRGFLAGVARKRLKLTFISEDAKTGRVYQVREKPARWAKI